MNKRQTPGHRSTNNRPSSLKTKSKMETWITKKHAGTTPESEELAS